MKYHKLKLCLFILLVTITSCGEGGTEAGNPGDLISTRVVTGIVPDSASTIQSTGSCAADVALFTDTEAISTDASVGTDCSFETNLPVDKYYAAIFQYQNGRVSTMRFRNGRNASTSNYFYVSAGDTAIDMGSITFDDDDATPEYEPSEQNDSDDDGINDYEDDDDDNDDIPDEDEEDCNHDGSMDDDDEVCSNGEG
ncbi:MAG: hypothetical protein HN337_09600, partial [Deltaproteobacteria bacterium]|nr:hypothetical protein [Deltaproteobacteria bacterium]